MKKTLSMLTMKGHQQTMDIISHSWDAFDRIILVDGNFHFNDSGSQIYSDYIGQDSIIEYDEYNNQIIKGKKLWVVDRPWNDNFSEGYQTSLDLLEEGEWNFICDSDEYPSPMLMENLDNIISESDNGNKYDIAVFPVVDFLDGKRLWEDHEVPQTYINGMWVKSIYVRKGKEKIKLQYAGDEIKNCHAIAVGTNYKYFNFPYYHKKKTEDFVKNELWEMFLTPEGQRLNPIECARFRRAIKMDKIETSQEFMERLENGNIGPLLKKLAVEYREQFIGPNNDLHPLNQMFVFLYLVNKNDTPPSGSHDLEWYYTYIRNWKKSNLTYKNFLKN